MLLALALAGYLFPFAGLIVASAYSLFLIGFLLAGFFKLELDDLELLAFSVLASVLISTHAVNALSFVFGYSRETIFLVFGLFGLLAFKGMPKIDLGKHKKILTYAALVFLFVFCVMLGSTWKQTPNGIANGGWNWSDFLVHLSFATTINAGIFPPQTPFFAGAPLVAHYFADFHSAIIAKAASVFPAQIMLFEQALYASLLFLAVFLFAEFLTRDRKTAALAAFLLIFAGGFGYLALADAHEPWLDAITKRSYDNNWDTKLFQVPSVLGTGLLTHRSTTIGFPVLVLVLLLFLKGLKNEKLLLAGGALGGLMFPFGYHTSVALCVLLGLFSVVSKKWPTWKVFLPFVLAVPFALAAFGRGTGAFKVFLGWLAPKDLIGFVTFYIANFGLVFLVGLAGLLLVKMKHKTLLASGMAAMFILPNLVSFTPIEWDMNRFFSIMMLFAVIPAAVVLREVWGSRFFATDKSSSRKRIAVPGIPTRIALLLGRWIGPATFSITIALSVLSPLLVSAWFVTSDLGVLSKADIAAADWISANTNAKDVFVTEAFINVPTDVAGRLRLLTFTPYVRNYALDPTELEKDLERIYCGPGDESLSLMNKYGAKYILYRGSPQCERPYTQDSRFEKVFAQDNVEMHEIKAT